MVPPPIATTAFIVSSALFTCPRCAIDAPVQRRGRGRGRGRDCYQYRTTSTAASNDDDNTSAGKGADADDACAQALNESPIEPTTTPTAKKPRSRLAMAAADWLEEEEEDELSMYWDRFDAAKAASKTNGGEQAKDRAVQVSAGQSTLPTTNDDNNANVSTEELLERYHERRGIDKEEERKYGAQIEKATRSAKCASSAPEAIRILDAVRPYLQYNTKLGGEAYLELAQALDANGDEGAATCTEIYKELATSPHGDVRRQAREMLACGAAMDRPKRQYRRGIWEMLWDAGWGD